MRYILLVMFIINIFYCTGGSHCSPDKNNTNNGYTWVKIANKGTFNYEGPFHNKYHLHYDSISIKVNNNGVSFVKKNKEKYYNNIKKFIALYDPNNNNSKYVLFPFIQKINDEVIIKDIRIVNGKIMGPVKKHDNILKSYSLSMPYKEKMELYGKEWCNIYNGGRFVNNHVVYNYESMDILILSSNKSKLYNNITKIKCYIEIALSEECNNPNYILNYINNKNLGIYIYNIRIKGIKKVDYLEILY